MLKKLQRRTVVLVVLVALTSILVPLPVLAYTYCYDEITVNGNNEITGCASVCEFYSNTTGEYQGSIRKEYQCT